MPKDPVEAIRLQLQAQRFSGWARRNTQIDEIVAAIRANAPRVPYRKVTIDAID